jgi:hypothetical protein
MEKF